MGPARLEGHVLKARLDRAPVRLCAGARARRRLHASGRRQRPSRGRRPRARRAGRADQPRRPRRRRPERRVFRGRGVGRAGPAPAGGADVWLARYIPHAVEVTIPRGENGGHTLPYTHVVRELVLLGKWRGGAASFPAPAGDPVWPRRRSCRQAEQGRSSRRRSGRGPPRINHFVIPAQVGNPGASGKVWMPAFAGMTSNAGGNGSRLSVRKVGRAVLNVLDADLV